jgi:hypothetical protein
VARFANATNEQKFPREGRRRKPPQPADLTLFLDFVFVVEAERAVRQLFLLAADGAALCLRGGNGATVFDVIAFAEGALMLAVFCRIIAHSSYRFGREIFSFGG